MGQDPKIKLLSEALEAQDIETLKSKSKELILEDENNPMGYYFLAEAYFLDEDLENAEILMAQAMDLEENDNIFYVLRLAQIKEEQGEYEDAIFLYNNILVEEEENIAALLGLARYYVSQEQNGVEALELIQQAESAAQSENDHALLKAIQPIKVQALLLEEQAEEALALINDLIEANPSVELCLLKIEILSNLIQQSETPNPAYLADSEAMFKKCMELSPEDLFNISMSYADFLVNTNQIDKAIAKYQELLSLLDNSEELNETRVEIYEALAVAYEKQNNTAKQIEMLNNIIALDTTNWGAYTSRASINMKAGNLKAAALDFKEAKKNVSEASKPYLLKEEAALYLSVKDFKTAFSIYKDLSAMTEEDDIAAEGYLGMAKVFQASNTNPDKAFEALSKAIKLGNTEAVEFAETHYADLYAQQNQNLAKNFQEHFESNKNNPFLQQCFNKMWMFDTALNNLGDMPKEMIKELSEYFENTIFYFTEQGFLSYDMELEKGLVNFYKVVKNNKNSVALEVTPATGESSYEIEFGFKKGNLTYGEGEDEAILKGLDIKELSSKDKQRIKNLFGKVDLSLLGEKATPLQEIL